MTIGLPVSRVVRVSVSLAALLPQATPINTLLILGTSNVIDIVERMRSYSTLTQVGVDFGTASPEYLAARAWFGQSPQPDQLFIGRWAPTATAGQLVGGGVAAANLLITPWNAFAAGAFWISVDGTPRALSGIDLSLQTNLNGVAAQIQAALRTATGGTELVVWNPTYDRFTFTSGTTGTNSAVLFLQAPRAVGYFNFAGQPAPADTITINGTAVTFVASGATGNQVNIGGSLAATLANLLSFVNSSVDANIALMQYLTTASRLYLTSKAAGTTGNAYTLAKSGTNIAVSAATMAGGVSTVNDISGMLAGLAASSGAYVVGGSAGETFISCILTFDSQFANQWYGLFGIGATDLDIEQAAAYIEGANPPHYYGINTNEAGVLVPNTSTDIGSILSTLLYNKSAIQYCSTSDYAMCSYLGKLLPVDWNGRSTALTMMWKQEPGIQPENINTTQADAAQAKHVNVYSSYNNGAAIIEYGTSCSGQFSDTVVGADALSGNIQARIFDSLLETPTKIPQTDAGMTVLLGDCNAGCVDFTTNGYLGPGQWNAAGFGGLKPGDFLATGYFCYAPPIATQSEATRQTRAAPLIQIAAKTAGAIHTSAVQIFVEQ